MKGRLELIGDWWYVRYTTYDGGGSFRLLVHPNFVDMTDFVIIKNDRFYNGDEVEFTQVLVNPMGREVDPNDLGQNHSKCKWYAKPSLGDKEDLGYTTKMGIEVSDEVVRETMIPKEYFGKDEQKQHLIDMMKSDEELGLYDEPDIKEIKLEDIFNDKKREGAKRVIQQHKVLKGLYLINPAHLQMTSNGHGEFPDGYKLTEKGIQYIIEQLNKE